MAEFTKYPPNTFCWPELLTTDLKGAQKFYGEILGWTFDESPMGDSIYAMLKCRDKTVGGMYERTAEQEKMGIPTNWLAYVSVEDVNAAASATTKAGAKTVMEPMDVMDIGKMAVFTDPAGALFALWQPINAIGSELANEPGSFTWNELYTNDMDGSGSFYTNVFGWSAQTQDMGGMMYTTFTNGDRPAAGMMEIQKEWGEVPPHWLTYFVVEDTDTAVEKIKKLGGTVTMGPQDIPEIGRFAVAIDPQGGAFAIIKLLNPTP